MKNLKNYGVQELSAQEIRETKGGHGVAYMFGWILGRISKYNGNATHIWGTY